MPQDDPPSTPNPGKNQAKPDELAPRGDLQARITRLSSQLENMSLYELLGVPRSADLSTIEHAYEVSLVDFHPYRCAADRLGPLKPKLEAIVLRMAIARNILGSADRRARYDAALAANRNEVIEELLTEARAETELADDVLGLGEIVESAAVPIGPHSGERPTRSRPRRDPR